MFSKIVTAIKNLLGIGIKAETPTPIPQPVPSKEELESHEPVDPGKHEEPETIFEPIKEDKPLNIKTNLLSLGKKARSGKKFTAQIDRLILHWIGPYIQKVESPRAWWENGSDGKGVQASAHFIVVDDDVLQCLPLDEIGYHSGDSRNNHSIGIEVIPMKTEANAYTKSVANAQSYGVFSEKTIETLRKLIKHIQKEIPTAKLIERHGGGDNGNQKDCPRYYTKFSEIPGGDDRWKELKKYLES